MHKFTAKKYNALVDANATTKVKPLEGWQLKLLKRINFKFDDAYDSLWMERYKEYKPVIEGNMGKIPSSDKEVVKWVQSQKRRYKEGTLENDRINLIEKIKFWSWNPFEERLENNLQRLELFYRETKDSNPKQNVNHKGFKVGRFLTSLRMKYRKEILDKKIIKRVEKLGFKLKPSRIIGSVYYYD